MTVLVKEYLPITIFTILQLILTYYVSLQVIIILSMSMILITSFINRDNDILIKIILFTGFIGFFADITLNIYSRNFGSRALQSYFDKVGPVVAASFAFCATIWMVLNTWIVSNALELNYNNVEEGVLIILIGFGFGVLWGAIGEKSRAMKHFLPFYKNTSGWLESRFWDGITLVFPIIILFLLNYW